MSAVTGYASMGERVAVETLEIVCRLKRESTASTWK
jgi:hypothetical protein